MHFLIDCPVYSDLRCELFNSMSLLCNSFLTLQSDMKFNLLMKTNVVQYLLGKTLFLMFKRRRLLITCN